MDTVKTDNYNPNLEVVDKSGIQNVTTDRNVIYSGNLNLIKSAVKKPDNDFRPLAAAVLGLNNTAAPLPDNLEFYHTWTDIDSQEAFLNSKPTSYIILAKPGTGGYTLGEVMAKKLNIVHISPKTVLVDEMEQKSLTGKCIDFNLRHNNICKHDTILAIMKKKTQSPAVQHRGFVISGVPLVTSSKNIEYFTKNLHDEESVLMAAEIVDGITDNVFKKRRKGRKHDSETINSSQTSADMLDIESEIEEEEDEQEPDADVEEEQVQIVALPKFILEPSSGVIVSKKTSLSSKQSVMLHQCQQLFDFLDNPLIIIFITCPDPDTITKKNRKYFNYLTSSCPMYPFMSRNDSDIRWPTKYAVNENVSNPIDTSALNRKYYCRLPINFISSATNQMCNYQSHVTPYLEKKIKDFESKFVIKLDGRTPIYEMANILFDKLLLLPVKPVLIPEPLYLEEPTDDIESFWQLAEEMNVIKFGAKRFSRYASPWYNRCPVELKKGHAVQGLSRFAVAFFNRIYLLSSLDNMVAFCRNPRSFLKLQYLEPTCRVIVTGTKSSGKSMVAHCLSWLFNAPVICYESFVNDLKQRKFYNFKKLIWPVIEEKVEERRMTEWENKEQTKMTNLNLWYTSCVDKLNNYIILQKEYLSIKNEASDNASSNGKDLFDRVQELRADLQFFPFLDEIKTCEQILNVDSLLQYAPPELTGAIPKPPLPFPDDDDVDEVIYAYISENNRQNDIESNSAEIMQELKTKLANLDIQTKTKSHGELEYGKYIIDGFPSDAEYWDFLLGSSLAPDYTVAIIEDREMDDDIKKQYINITTSTKNHETRFRLANDPLVKIKLESKYTLTPEPVTLEFFINDIISIIVQSMFINESEIINTLNETIYTFRGDWVGLKANITNTDKACIEVQIESKSDIQIVEEVLVKIRNSYCPEGSSEVDETFVNQGSDESTSNDSFIHNDSRFLCETNVYCPIAYYDYGILWEGRPEFIFKYDNKLHYFSKEEFLNRFQGDVTKYQSYNEPFKKLSPMRICVMGPIGCGKTSAAKLIAKEYGLMYIDFVEFINNNLIPRHYKRVGRQYENSFTDSPIDEEAVTDLNMNEDNVNLEAEILANEFELRRMVYNYLEKGTAIIPILMQKLMKLLWFQPPYSTTGFVLDGFPKLQNDVEDMTECFCIPDLIIELECNTEIASQRLSPKLFDSWKIQLNEAKQKARLKFDNEKRQWKDFVTKRVVVKVIIDSIIDTIAVEALDQAKNLSIQSTIIEAHPSGMSNVDTNLFNTYNNVISEYPEPVDRSTWEKPSDVREKIAYRIESTYEIEDDNIQTLKETLIEQNIKLTTINGTKSLIKVGRLLLSKVANLRNKREVCFEQSFVIDLDVAEMLLLEGFFFLSKFYRMCPVYIFDNPNAIFNTYSITKSKSKIVPVIHRSHIYFICNNVNLKKFRDNPLKYIVNDSIKHFVEYPLRVAVIGPPKSGKSELTAKLAKKYGLLCVSKGIALRHIVNDLSWTELALKTLSKLGKGESVSNYFVMQAVQTLINSYCSSSRGFILDGLPSSPFEALELQKLGLFPLIVFEVRGPSRIMIKNSQNEIYPNIIKIKPPYSHSFIRHRLLRYIKRCNGISEFINNDTQNLITLKAEDSRWKSFYKTDIKICEIIPHIHYYLTNYKTTAVPMSVMCVTDNYFQLKMSNYKNFCPVCLSDDIIKHSGYPVDKKGIVRYKEHVYWICNDHLDFVLNNPVVLLKENVCIPEIPTVVKTINPLNLYEDGICIVTYAENLPAQRVEKGKEEYAAVYKEKTYLFCTPICLRKFLATPKMYYDITVFKERKVFPAISLKSLPHLGYLEQTVGNLITEACCSVNVARPKYPGLTVQISGLLYVAFYLKIHNPLVDASHLPLYKKSLKTFESRCQLMTSVGRRLRSLDNPFARYPKCCGLKDIQEKHDGTEPDPIATDSGTVIKPSSPKQESILSFARLYESD